MVDHNTSAFDTLKGLAEADITTFKSRNDRIVLFHYNQSYAELHQDKVVVDEELCAKIAVPLKEKLERIFPVQVTYGDIKPVVTTQS